MRRRLPGDRRAVAKDRRVRDDDLADTPGSDPLPEKNAAIVLAGAGAFCARENPRLKAGCTDMDISIHCTVSSNSLRYFAYLRANCRALMSGDNRLRFIAYCLDRSSARRLRGEAGIGGI